jgi:hypothetical protein
MTGGDQRLPFRATGFLRKYSFYTPVDVSSRQRVDDNPNGKNSGQAHYCADLRINDWTRIGFLGQDLSKDNTRDCGHISVYGISGKK